MPTVLACLRRSVERMWPRRVPTRFGPATRLRRPKNQWNQGPLATQQAEMCPRTANSGLEVRRAGAGGEAQPPPPPPRGHAGAPTQHPAGGGGAAPPPPPPCLRGGGGPRPAPA